MRLILCMCSIATVGLLMACSANNVPNLNEHEQPKIAASATQEAQKQPQISQAALEDPQVADVAKEKKQRKTPLSAEQKMQIKRMRAALNYDKKMLEEQKLKYKDVNYEKLLEKAQHIDEQITLAESGYGADERKAQLENIRSQYLNLRHEIDAME